MGKIYIMSFFFIFLFTSLQGQNITLIDSILLNMYDELEQEWNNKGYWGEARIEKDNRYNEAIIFYAKMNSFYKINNIKKVKKAISYSFLNFQEDNGAFIQENKPSYVRTAMFLIGLAECYNVYKQLNYKKYLNEINKALKYLYNSPRSYTGNQGIAALTAFYLWSQILNKDSVIQYFIKQREFIINDFIQIDSTKGFWPEGPRHWSINVPYAQIQSIFLGKYLLLNPNDKKLLKLYKTQLNSFFYLYDLDSMNINVINSAGNFRKNGIKTVKSSTPSVFFLKAFLYNDTLTNSEKIIIKSYQHYKEKYAKRKYVLSTDAYYRFGIIKEIEIKQHENISN